MSVYLYLQNLKAWIMSLFLHVRSALTFFLLLAFYSCEQELAIDQCIKENRLVLNCIITSDSTMQFYLGKTSSPYIFSDFEQDVDNAAVSFSNSTNDQILIRKNDYEPGYSFPEKLQNNSLYTIKIDYPGFTGISAQSYLPSKIEIRDYEGEIEKNDKNETILTNKFTINTSQSEFLAVRQIIYERIVNIFGDTISFTDTAWISPAGYSLNSILPGNAINNILFTELNQNTVAEIGFESYDGFIKSENLIEGISEFEFISCSEQYYNYLRSYILYTWNKKDANSSVLYPLSVFSNVENGFGIFGGYDKTVYRVKYR